MKTLIEVNPGDMYGSWRVIEEVTPNVWVDKHGLPRNVRMLRCICTECGETVKAQALNNLRSGITKRCRSCGDKVRSRKCIADKRQIPMLVAATLNVVQHMSEEQLNRLWAGVDAAIKHREGAGRVSNGH